MINLIQWLENFSTLVVSFGSSRFFSLRATHSHDIPYATKSPLQLSHHPRSFCGCVPLIMSPPQEEMTTARTLIFFSMRRLFLRHHSRRKGIWSCGGRRRMARDAANSARRLIQWWISRWQLSRESFWIKDQPLLPENAPRRARAAQSKKLETHSPQCVGIRGWHKHARGNYSNWAGEE